MFAAEKQLINFLVNLYQYIKMISTKIFFFLALSLLFFGSIQVPCPASDYRGNIYSAKLTIANHGGAISINNDEDTQCYNHSLPYNFSSIPDVAISIHDFEAETSNSLNFFIKPIKTNSLTYVPFVVRTQSSYTQWNFIQFSFIVEDRTDFEAGYYLVDPGPLSGCGEGKSVDIILPFRNKFSAGRKISHNIFLHGFQIYSRKTQQGGRSPYELQIAYSSANTTGVVITLSVTTVTSVYSVYISYIAFQDPLLAVNGGGFVYDSVVTPNENLIYHYPEVPIPRNYARMYGITGFLLNYIPLKISLSTKWDGSIFTAQLGNDIKQVKYLSYNYIFFTGLQCQDCNGYQIFEANQCMNNCPIGTGKTQSNTCTRCGLGRQWNGTNCIISCTNGQILNQITGICQCPPTLIWNDEACIQCTNGKIWKASKKICQCAEGFMWDNYGCIRIDQCTAGKKFDIFTYSCQCPQTTFWNGLVCQQIPQCLGGRTLNSNYQCVCQNGYVWQNQQCVYTPCAGGQIWSGKQCICPSGLNFNGSMCIQCINGQKWNSKQQLCQCPSGYRWSGQLCEKSYICSNGRAWSTKYQQCVCPQGFYWGGYSCQPNQQCFGGQYFDTTISKCLCLSGFNWNGKSCVQCKNGRVWNITTLSCTCSLGSIETKFGCKLQQTCSGGKQWIQNSWSCQCPQKSTWDGSSCIMNICLNGQIWNQTIKACQCPGNKVYINQTCVPPKINCVNGKVWNQFIYSCQCPKGTFSDILTCKPIPTCTLGKIYNPLNNKCQCPFGLIQQNQRCSEKKCPIGQYYNGYLCQIINCPPPSYFQKDKCVIGSSNRCNYGYLWNGKQCIYSPTDCPTGTIWSGSSCQTRSNQCPNGYYTDNNNCLPLEQLCIPPSRWDGQRCVLSNSICPKGTYAQGGKCMPYQSCKNGFVWDPNFLRCLCPPGTINNGNKCIECPSGKKWVPDIGCTCPQGSFDAGASCQAPNNIKCSAISNSAWIDNKCLCKTGFTKVGFQCICYGTQLGDFCDKCSYKVNSKYNAKTNLCECNDGYTQIKGQCIQKGQQISNEDPSKCRPGSYFDINHRDCLPCQIGCLSCKDCYRCNICQPGFVYDSNSERCFQLCGDGKKFVQQCDDGNNFDGDGCSRDCKIQSGYACTGGNPESKDNCYVYRPQRVQIELVGQIRKATSIQLNIKLNYLPSSILKSIECENKCSKILLVSVSQSQNPIAINSEYLAGTQYIFSISIEFGRSYIGKFKANIGIKSGLSKYFGGLPIKGLQVNVEPSYLMALSINQSLS